MGQTKTSAIVSEKTPFAARTFIESSVGKPSRREQSHLADKSHPVEFPGGSVRLGECEKSTIAGTDFPGQRSGQGEFNRGAFLGGFVPGGQRSLAGSRDELEDMNPRIL